LATEWETPRTRTARAGRGAGAGAAGAEGTARTRALSGGDGVTPRRPRPGPTPGRAEQAAGANRSARGRRLFAALFALVALALVIVGLVIATAPGPTRISLRNVVYSDVEQTSVALQELVRENTK
jgi:hypothetical protein